MNDVSLLQELLKIYSPTDQEEEAVAYLIGQMQQMGYTACTDPAGNAVGTRGQGLNEIILLGHIDTVPGYIDVRTEGDILYGRGSVDAKGPLACFVAAGAKFNPPLGWKITVIGAVGEEGSSKGAAFLCDRYHPKALIIGEPSKWDRITLGFKGSAWFDYQIRRPKSHTAGKDENACEIAVRFWNDLQAWCTAYTSEDSTAYTRLIPTLSAMQSTTDDFYDMAQLKISIRLPPGITPQEVASGLHSLLKENAGITLESGLEAYKAEKNTALVRAFLNAIRKAGGKPNFSLKTGTSDMNIVTPVWKCQAVAYGPGDSSLDHTPDEHISISEYQMSIEILTDVLDQLCSGNTHPVS